MNLQKKIEQDDATQIKRKSLALKDTQDSSSSKDSTNEDDNLTFIIKKANKMMKKKFNKRRNFQRSNWRKNEIGSINCYECNKLSHIKKNCLNLNGKARKFFKKKKGLYVGWDESQPSDSENKEKD